MVWPSGLNHPRASAHDHRIFLVMFSCRTQSNATGPPSPVSYLLSAPASGETRMPGAALGRWPLFEWRHRDTSSIGRYLSTLREALTTGLGLTLIDDIAIIVVIDTETTGKVDRLHGVAGPAANAKPRGASAWQL